MDEPARSKYEKRKTK